MALFVLTILMIAILVVPVAITAFFAIELLAGLRPLPPLQLRAEAMPSNVIVVPAHDEEVLIATTVATLAAEIEHGCRILVVADNCKDRTAQRARDAGAEVIVRNDPDRRGKGFALAAARDALRAGPPQVVLIIDADCRIDRKSLETLARVSAESGRPAQAAYMFVPNRDASVMVQISNFAFMLKNLIRQRGLQRLAGRAHLTGTGMAFPWRLFDDADLGGANIVEDLALGLQLSERGYPPVFVQSAQVWSEAAADEQTLVQRRRWEGGSLSTAMKMVPRNLLRGLSRGDFREILAAFDLGIPPLAMLVLLNLAAFVLGLLAWTIEGFHWPIMVQVALGLLALVALIIAWAREGRTFISARALVRLPLYVLWKIPLYMGLVRGGAPRDWIRTGR